MIDPTMTESITNLNVKLFPPRREKLRLLALKYWISIRDDYESCRSAAEEDIMEYLTMDEALWRWAAITMTGGSEQDYFIEMHKSRRAAVAATIEYVTDDIFAESPVAICDLDSDEEPWGKLYGLKRLIPVYATD